MNVIYTAVYVRGDQREVVEMKFRKASITDISFHIKDVREDMESEGYSLETFEIRGETEDG